MHWLLSSSSTSATRLPIQHLGHGIVFIFQAPIFSGLSGRKIGIRSLSDQPRALEAGHGRQQHGHVEHHQHSQDNEQ